MKIQQILTNGSFRNVVHFNRGMQTKDAKHKIFAALMYSMKKKFLHQINPTNYENLETEKSIVYSGYILSNQQLYCILTSFRSLAIEEQNIILSRI